MKWSNKWKSSKNPTKQRNYIANAPLHKKKNMIKANLGKDIQKNAKRRSFGIRAGDEVIIKRGGFKGQFGEVLTVNTKRGAVTVKGMIKKKVNGTEYNVLIRSSNLQIIKLNLDDKRRIASLNKKTTGKDEKTTKDTKAQKEIEKKTVKTAKDEKKPDNKAKTREIKKESKDAKK